MLKSKTITIVWLSLILLTLLTATQVESEILSIAAIIFICTVVSIKGFLVIDHLMGLRHAPYLFRWVMLSYFIILPPLIAVFVIFPDMVVVLTSL